MTSSVANCLNIYTFITFLLVVWFYSNFFCSAHKFFSSCWKSYYFVVDSPLKIMKTVWNSSSSLKLLMMGSWHPESAKKKRKNCYYMFWKWSQFFNKVGMFFEWKGPHTQLAKVFIHFPMIVSLPRMRVKNLKGHSPLPYSISHKEHCIFKFWNVHKLSCSILNVLVGGLGLPFSCEECSP